MLLASEVTAAALVIDYWPSSVNVGVWIAIVLIGKSIFFALKHFRKLLTMDII